MNEWDKNIVTVDITEIKNAIDLPNDLSGKSSTSNELFRIFRNINPAIIDRYIDPIVKSTGITEYLIQKTPNLRIVMPDQDTLGQRLFWHQGIWNGNGTGMLTIWTPLTKAFNTNTLHIATLDESKYWTKKFRENTSNSYEYISKFCEDICKPVNLNPGQALLFTQEHWHGQKNNETNQIRISFETRILLPKGEFSEKHPGAYFRKPFYYTKLKKGFKNAMLIPQFDGPYFCKDSQYIQTLVMNEYCKNFDIEISNKSHDLNTTNCSYTKWLAKEKHYDNIVLPSLYSLQINDLEDLFNTEQVFHFASEELVVDDNESKQLAMYYRTF